MSTKVWTHLQRLYTSGAPDIETLGLKISIALEHFDWDLKFSSQDWNFRSGLDFVDRRALWDSQRAQGMNNFQYFASGLKFSSDQSQIEIFNRESNFQAGHTTRPLFVGDYQGRD